MDKYDKIAQALRCCVGDGEADCHKDGVQCPYLPVPTCVPKLNKDAADAIDALRHEIEQLRQRPDVVRCKDCRFHYDEAERASETYWMPCDDYVTMDNWFCGWGKRKDGGT